MTGLSSIIPSKALLLILMMFGIFQLVLFFQTYSTVIYTQSSIQCDCSRTNHLRIEAGVPIKKTGNLTSQFHGKFIEKEKVYSNISWRKELSEEDKRLDKEWYEKNQNTSIVEDMDEIEPYQKEVLGPVPVKRIRKPDIPMYSHLTLNSEIDDHRSRCNGNHSNMLLFYVYSAPGNFNQRKRIRRTWGSIKTVYDKEIRVVFFIGQLSRQNMKHYPTLQHESQKNGDIVHDISYIDAYRNLTLKGISAMQWIVKYCPQPYRVVKVDDDTLVNPFQMVKFLSGQTEETMSEIICRWSPHARPIRNFRSKYHVSVAEYDKGVYPPYCQGYGYILPPTVIPSILKNIYTRKLITMEDVYFTGLVREVIGTKIHALTAAFVTQSARFEFHIFLERITSRPELILIGHVHDDRSAELYWKLITEREAESKPTQNNKNNTKNVDKTPTETK